MHIVLFILLVLTWKIECKFYPNRIWGGNDISIERAPYYVQLIYTIDFKCGGSILTRQVILTAAHCIRFSGPSHILAGSDRLMKGARFVIQKRVKHPNYCNPTHNDVALLLLDKQLNYSPQIQPIFIPNDMTQSLVTGTQLLTVGFGQTSPNPPLSGHLQEIFLPMISEKDCSNYLITQNYTEFSSQFCLGNLTILGRATCNGDSGGPVTYNEMQYGVVSWGDDCVLKGVPGVFANLITLNSWIRQTAKNMGHSIP